MPKNVLPNACFCSRYIINTFKVLCIMAILKFNIVYDRKHATEEGKPGSVEIRFSLSRKQKYFATGIRIAHNEWDNNKNKVVRRPDKDELNKRLAVLCTKADKIVSKSYSDDNFDFTRAPRSMTANVPSNWICLATVNSVPLSGVCLKALRLATVSSLASCARGAR